MSDEQINDMRQEFALHKIGGSFGFKSCDEINIDVLWDYNPGEVYDGRIYVDYGKKIF